MNASTANIPEVTSTTAGIGEVTLTEEDVKAPAHPAGAFFEVTPLSSAEIAQAGGVVPNDWAESLTNLSLAVRELEDSIPTRNRAVTEAAMAKLQANAAQLRAFLSIRGLTV